jgi:hypothetical protein
MTWTEKTASTVIASSTEEEQKLNARLRRQFWELGLSAVCLLAGCYSNSTVIARDFQDVSSLSPTAIALFTSGMLVNAHVVWESLWKNPQR